jgi:SAM-dependent methyltransferase
MTFAPEWEDIHKAKVWGNMPNGYFRQFYDDHFLDFPEAVFLDLGCGTGASSGFLVAQGHEVYAVDGSPTAVSNMITTTQRTPELIPRLHAWVQDVCTIELPPQSIDCIVDVCSLQHIISDREIVDLIDKSRRWLKPGGRFFSMGAAQPYDVIIVPSRAVRLVTEAAVFRHFRHFTGKTRKYTETITGHNVITDVKFPIEVSHLVTDVSLV